MNRMYNMKNTRSTGPVNVFLEGRATRREWWSTCLWTLFWGILWILFWVFFLKDLILIFSRDISSANRIGEAIWIYYFLGRPHALLILFCVYRMVPVTVRRLHDIGMSGWWYLFFYLCGCIPYVGIIFDLILFVAVGLVEGNTGDNDYGQNPRELKNLKNVKNTISDNIKTRLKELDELKKQGLINESEHDAHKNRILLESEYEDQEEPRENNDFQGDNVKARLMELKELKHQGCISENEYKEQKDQILLEI